MSFPPDPSAPLDLEPSFPAGEGPIVILADASTALERALIEGWARRQDAEVEFVALTPSRRRRPGRRTDPALGRRIGRGDDPLLVPVRVIWMPPERHGRRTASWRDVLKLGDPRDPDPLRQYVILGWFPGRVGIVAGEPARATELLRMHETSVEVSTLVEFVTRRAHLALERAERSIRGNRYKVPRLLHAEIVGQAEFRDGVTRLGAERGLPPDVALARARYYLREIAAGHSTFLIDLIANAIHWLYRRGYGAILYDETELQGIAGLGTRYPIAFVPSHRSNLDRLSLQFLLWENDLPPNHTAAGINMNFFPVGPLIRRTGAFFIRRSFKDNDLYKFVLRTYLDYLVERRFPLEWYMEGGRSRSGKLLPPRLGMLGWVVDAVTRGKAEDLFLVPTSIAYDEIIDVADYASEALGGAKSKESFGWVLDKIRTLGRRHGNIHIRFAEPISVTSEMDPESDGRLELQKLSFEVMYRISQVTPITPTSVVSIALLSGRGRAMTLNEIARIASDIDAHIERRGLPTTEALRLEDPVEVGRVVARLVDQGSVTRFDAGIEPVHRLQPRQALEAAYYRNTIVHFFVPGAIAELALAGLGENPSAEAFWTEVFDLRDLLKFEFFFSGREEFMAEIESVLTEASGTWTRDLTDPQGARRLLERLTPLRAHWSLLPFLEAYLVMADQLVRTVGEVEDKAFVAACLDLGEQYRLQNLVEADESVSKVLFAAALALARNRGLTDEETGPEQLERRRALARRMRELVGRAREVGAMADTRAFDAIR